MLNFINNFFSRGSEQNHAAQSAPTSAASAAPPAGDQSASGISNSTTLISSGDPKIIEFLGGGRSASGYAVTDTSAMKVSTVARCIFLIGGAIAGMPLPVYERNADGRKRIESPLWYLLNEQPHPQWTAASMWEWIIKCQALRGDGFAEILRNAGGITTGIRPLHPDRVRVEVANERLRYYINPVEGKPYGRDQDDILHFPGYGFDGTRGMSVIQFAAFSSIGIALAADDFSGKFYKNGASPKHLITSAGKMDDDKIDDLRRAYSERYTGVENVGKPMVLTQGLDIKEMSMSAVDAELLDSRKYQVVDICRAFGVPPFMAGATESASNFGTGIEQQKIGFVNFTLQSYLTRIQQELNRKLFRTEKYFVEFNLDGLLRGDSKSESDYLRQAIGGSQGPGWMTKNEVRRVKNLPPLPGGNELYEPKGTQSEKEPAKPAEGQREA